MKKIIKTDFFVIGTGTAGQTAAIITVRNGMNVTIVDKEKYGGTCLLRGCDPKKILVGAAEIIERASALNGKGIIGQTEIDWSELNKYKDNIIREISEDVEKRLQKEGVRTLHGKARFIGKDSAIIDNNTIIKFKKALIATGSKPAPLKIPGEEHIITSTEFLNTKNIPEKITFIGGGYISFEFAHIASTAGSKTTIIHRSKRPLKNFDKDLVEKLTYNYRKKGINIILNTAPKKVVKKGNEYHILTTSNRKIKTNLIVHGAGRIPDIDELDLEKAGISYSKRGIEVNKYLQNTKNKNIYAAGDAADSGKPLTPKAAIDGKIVGINVSNKKKTKAIYGPIPSVVFSHPPLASVGVTQEEIEKKSSNIKIVKKNTSNWYTSRRIGVSNTGYKVIFDENERIIGAHLYMPNADEVINIFALAIKNAMKKRELKDILYTYPTTASDIKYMV